MNQQDRPAGYPPPESYPPQYPPTQGYPQSGFPPPSFYGITPAPQPPPKKPRRVLTIVASVFVTLVLVLIALAVIGSTMTPTSSGPAPSRPVPTQQAPAPQVTPAPVVPAPVVPAPTQAPTTVAPDTSSSYDSTRFGRSAVVGNGLQVQAGIPESFTPSATAAGNSGVRAFVTEITVRNGTGQALNPSMITASASVNGQEAGSVFDSAQDIGLPTTIILPGHSVTYRAVFSSPVEHGAVQVDVSPGFSNGTASFTGTDL